MTRHGRATALQQKLPKEHLSAATPSEDISYNPNEIDRMLMNAFARLWNDETMTCEWSGASYIDIDIVRRYEQARMGIPA